MREQRRHQRIRFNHPPCVRIGQGGKAGRGELENLSLGGLMLRTDLSLVVGAVLGCEFSVLDSSSIDLAAVVVSKVGDCYGTRFQLGPISASLIEQALASGKASILSINEREGRKTMRIGGGLNACLRSDFMHGLTRVGVDEMDLSAVTGMDRDGLELCRIAVEQYRVALIQPSPCVASGLAGYIL